mgnify:CR=1 FL=1
MVDSALDLNKIAFDFVVARMAYEVLQRAIVGARINPTRATGLGYVLTRCGVAVLAQSFDYATAPS